MAQDRNAVEGRQGPPLPDSEEAREEEIPEHLVREKGHGDDAQKKNQADGERVAPDWRTLSHSGRLKLTREAQLRRNCSPPRVSVTLRIRTQEFPMAKKHLPKAHRAGRRAAAAPPT